jgi:hypothetical protein
MYVYAHHAHTHTTHTHTHQAEKFLSLPSSLAADNTKKLWENDYVEKCAAAHANNPDSKVYFTNMSTAALPSVINALPGPVFGIHSLFETGTRANASRATTIRFDGNTMSLFLKPNVCKIVYHPFGLRRERSLTSHAQDLDPLSPLFEVSVWRHDPVTNTMGHQPLCVLADVQLISYADARPYRERGSATAAGRRTRSTHIHTTVAVGDQHTHTPHSSSATVAVGDQHTHTPHSSSATVAVDAQQGGGGSLVGTNGPKRKGVVGGEGDAQKRRRGYVGQHKHTHTHS